MMSSVSQFNFEMREDGEITTNHSVVIRTNRMCVEFLDYLLDIMKEGY